MGEIKLLHELRAGLPPARAEARARARGRLAARFEVGAQPLPRRRPAWRGWRLRLAAAGACVALVAAVAILSGVFSGGSRVEPAAAEILRETATVASAGHAPAAIPGPGQYLYKKFQRVELEGWIPVDQANPNQPLGSMGGLMTQPGAFNALMPTTQEWWTGNDMGGRVREVAGTPRFLSDEEQSRWEAAGSPLPSPFDPDYQRKYSEAFKDAIELRRGVVDREVPAIAGVPKNRLFHFPDTSRLPTEPKALRRAVESNQISVTGFNLLNPKAKHLDAEETKEQLLNILVEGTLNTPQLRAAIFNALAELPGIDVYTDATDSLGREGYSIRSINKYGGLEFIFDPDTAEILAQRSFLTKPGDSPYEKGLPAGFTMSETAYLETGVTDSIHETPAEAEAGGPVATTGPVYRK